MFARVRVCFCCANTVCLTSSFSLTYTRTIFVVSHCSPSCPFSSPSPTVASRTMDHNSGRKPAASAIKSRTCAPEFCWLAYCSNLVRWSDRRTYGRPVEQTMGRAVPLQCVSECVNERPLCSLMVQVKVLYKGVLTPTLFGSNETQKSPWCGLFQLV